MNLLKRLECKSYKTLQNTLATIFANGIQAYWCDFENFGDQITPLLLRFYGYTPLHSTPGTAQIISTGSILEHVPHNYCGLILGSGFISSSSVKSFPQANILATRGRLTQDRLGLSHAKIKLGDTGLLAAKLLKKQPG